MQQDQDQGQKQDRISNNNASLEQFAENLLLEKDLRNIDEPTLRQMREDLVDRLERVTDRVVVENIPVDKLPEFEKMVDAGAKPAEVQAFVSANVPDLAPKLTEAYFDFRRLYLGL